MKNELLTFILQISTMHSKNINKLITHIKMCVINLLSLNHFALAPFINNQIAIDNSEAAIGKLITISIISL